jgi:hypothetical protein
MLIPALLHVYRLWRLRLSTAEHLVLVLDRFPVLPRGFHSFCPRDVSAPVPPARVS